MTQGVKGSEERVVVVTGASSGVGRAIVREFGGRGYKVGMIARNEEALSAAAEEIRERGGEPLALPVDVSDADAVEQAAATVVEKWGRLDVWVNCAMVTVFAPVAQITPDEYKRVTEVTYLGCVHGTQAALRHMQLRNSGTIIQIGSTLAYRSIPLQSAYCAAKAAMRGFTDSLRTELIHSGSNVRLSMLLLPAVDTPQSIRQRNKLPDQSQPVPPMYEPESIASLVAWSADHAPREMLIGWPTVKAIWGQRFIPRILDIYLGKTGYKTQMIDTPNDQDGRDILFTTLPGDPGAHGPYRDREQGADLQMRLRPHTRALAAAAGIGCLIAVKAVVSRS